MPVYLGAATVPFITGLDESGASPKAAHANPDGELTAQGSGFVAEPPGAAPTSLQCF